MERIVYNKTLDTHKSGIQFTLQGFETADKMSRRIVISLMANGDTIDLPLEQVEAVMYVTTPNAAGTSINACTIKGNAIIYDVLPITEEGITIMQLKLIETRPDGVASVLATPRFAVEVIKSDVDDDGIEGTTTYTAVEEAIARAKGVYESRLLRIALNSDCMFCAYYADGTIYESDILKEFFLKGDALLSQSYARGGTGIRDGEETDNSMYYCNVSKSASTEAQDLKEDTQEILEEARLHGVYTSFSVDFETGEVEYVSPSYSFKINAENGDLEAMGEAYTFEDNIRAIVDDWLAHNNVEISRLLNTTETHSIEIEDLQETTQEHGTDISVLKQGLSDITKEMLNGVLKQYNESTQSCMRDTDGAIICELEEYTFCNSRELTKIGANDSSVVTDTFETDYKLSLGAMQPELTVEIYCTSSTNDVAWALDSIGRYCTGYLYDASNDKLLGQGSGSFSGYNTTSAARVCKITISDNEMVAYIHEKSPELKFVLESWKVEDGDNYSYKTLNGLYFSVAKAKHFAYELFDLTEGAIE